MVKQQDLDGILPVAHVIHGSPPSSQDCRVTQEQMPLMQFPLPFARHSESDTPNGIASETVNYSGISHGVDAQCSLVAVVSFL